MYRIFKETLKIDFLKMRNIMFGISVILIVFGAISFVVRGTAGFGVDFTGGCLHQLRFENEVDIPQLREGLQTLGLTGLPIQQFGDKKDVLIKAPLEQDAPMTEIALKIDKAVQEVYPDNPFQIMRTEAVGPAVGKELRAKAVKAAVFAVLCIAIYVAFRFEFVFAVGALVALAHDALITLGLCSLFNIEISLNVVAAILTILGYSINDTIVIYDRIREEQKLNRRESLYNVINSSINQTMNRTIVTSFTTALVVVCLFVAGGEVIRDFSFALLVGIITGTYSSIFIASGVLILFQNKLKKDG